jgi:hypothetical protein
MIRESSILCGKQVCERGPVKKSAKLKKMADAYRHLFSCGD